ncbi:hypothetical protein ACU686_22310 [Yinghuangia aomiensis]
MVASGLCGLAPGGDAAEAYLLTARAVQGMGAALMLPVATTLIADVYEERERGRAPAAYAGLGRQILSRHGTRGGGGPHRVLRMAVGLPRQRAGRRADPLGDRPGARTHRGRERHARRGPTLCRDPLAGPARLGALHGASPGRHRIRRTLTALVTGASALALTVRLVLRSPEPLGDLRLPLIRPYAVEVALTFPGARPRRSIVAVHGTLFLRAVPCDLVAPGHRDRPSDPPGSRPWTTGTFPSGWYPSWTAPGRSGWPVPAGPHGRRIGCRGWTAALPTGRRSLAGPRG